MRVDHPNDHRAYHLIYKADTKPMGKPRMTRRDAWNKRPVVKRWNAYKDFIRLSAWRGFQMPHSNYWMMFLFLPPKRKSIQEMLDLEWTPHQQRPDKDNLEKGVLDILLPDDDSMVYDGRVTKIWAPNDGIEIWWNQDGMGTG